MNINIYMLVNSIVWKFDMFIYRLFYWRWNNRLKENVNIFNLFKEWVDNYEHIEK